MNFLLAQKTLAAAASAAASAASASLEQASEADPFASSPFSGAALHHFPNHWPAQGDLVTWCQEMGPGLAALLVLLGVVYLLFGCNIFKPLVLLNAAVVGAIIGSLVGGKADAAVPGAVTGAVLAGAITLPLMKWAVAVMGGICGAVLAACIWRTAGQDPAFTWAGAMTGLVGGGLLCFILFRGSIMAYTSLQGSAMLILGILGLLLKYQDLAPQVGGYLQLKPFVLPLCVLIPTVVGVLFQQHTPAPAAPAKK